MDIPPTTTINTLFDDYLVKPTLPFFKTLSVTPNHLTTLSFIASLGAVYSVCTQNIPILVITWILAYYFDCLDGAYARAYNQTTTFGSFYDHFTDLLFYIALTMVILMDYQKQLKPWMIIIVLILSIISLIDMYSSNQTLKTYTRHIAYLPLNIIALLIIINLIKLKTKTIQLQL